MRDYIYRYLPLLSLALLSGISLDLSLGEAYNIQLSEISVQGYTDAGQGSVSEAHNAPKTHGFRNPQYYSIRLRESRYEIELIHHKLYLDEGLPNGVSHFEVTDGYNLLMANICLGFDKKGLGSDLFYRVGLGTVIAHPDITINGSRYFARGGGLFPAIWTDGYHSGGFSSQLSGFYRKQIKNSLSLHMELKMVYAHTKITLDSIEDLYDRYEVVIPNFSFHILGGISFGK